MAEKQALPVLFMRLLTSAVADTAPLLSTALTAEVREALLRIAEKHDLTHLYAAALRRAASPMGEAEERRLSKAALLSLYRYEQMNAVYQRVSALLSEAAIDFVPLKGSIIRPYYPEPAMRQSCDIDILIHEADLDRAVALLTNEGYRAEAREFHDVSLYSPEGVHIELHFSILENQPSLDAVLARAWDHTLPTDVKHAHAFTPDFFCFHMLAHMAYHMEKGGAGLRSLLDLHIMKTKMGVSYRDALPLLSEAGIAVFAERMTALSDALFEGRPLSPEEALLLAFLTRGGSYGSLGNLAAFHKAGKGSRLSLLFRRAFPPYRTMKEFYPILKKCPVLLPILWIVRMVTRLFGGSGKATLEKADAVSAVSQEEAARIAALRSYLDL